jgi:integrase
MTASKARKAAPGQRLVTYELRPSGNVRLRWRFAGKPQSITYATATDALRAQARIEDAGCNLLATDPNVQDAFRPDLVVARNRRTGGRTVLQQCEQVLAQRSQKPQSQERYRYAVAVLADLHGEPIATIGAAQVNRWIAAQTAAPNTVIAAVNVLRGAVTLAQAEGLRPDNLSARGTLRLPKAKKVGQAITREQYAQLLATAQANPRGHGRHDAALYQLLVFGGLRIGEALALQIGDIDLVERQIHVQRSQVNGGRLVQLGATSDGKSERADRWVDLTAGLVQVLGPLVAGRGKGEWLFTRTDGKTMLPQATARPRFQRNLKRAGLPAVRLHDLRHTCGSWLLADPNVAEAEVAAHLGHSVAVLRKTYTHRTAQGRARLLAGLEALEPTAAPTPLRRRRAG